MDPEEDPIVARHYDALGRATLAVDSDQDPEKTAKIIQLSQATGIPAPAIEPAPELFQNNFRRQLISNVVGSSAALVNYIHENPLAEKVSRDDWMNLKDIHDAVNGTYSRGGIRAFSAGAAKTLESWGHNAVSLLGAITGNEEIQANARKIGMRPGTYISEAEDESFAGKLGGVSASLVPAVATLIGATFAGAPTLGMIGVAAGFGLMGGEEARREALEHGRNQYLAFGLRAGVDTAFGLIPGYFFLRPVEVAAPGIASWLVATVKNMALAGAGMAAGGELQHAIDTALAYNVYNPDASYHFDALSVMANAVGGAFLGGLSPKTKAYKDTNRTVPPGMHDVIDQLKRIQAKADAENLDAQMEKVRASQTHELAPDYVENLIRQSGDSEIAIPIDAIRLLYGDKKPEAGDNILGWVKDIDEQWKAAEKTGGDVTISRAEWLTKVDPEVAKALRDDIRHREGGVTIREGKQLEEWRKLVPGKDDEVTMEPPNEKGDTIVKSGGDFLSLRVGPDAVQAGMAGAKPKGQGTGTRMYEKAIEFATSLGKPFRSDFSVSADAVRVYEALERRGYTVKEAEGTTTTESGKTNATKGYVFEVTDNRDAFDHATDALRGQAGISDEPPPGVEETPFPGSHLPHGPAFKLGGSKFVRTQTQTRVYDSIGSTDVSSALDSLDTTHLNGVFKDFLSELKAVLKKYGNVPVHVVSSEVIKKFGGPAGAWYDPVHHNIIFNELEFNSARGAETLLHESIHAATSRVLNSRPEIRARIQKLMDHARSVYPNIQQEYGMTNTNEFVAESSSNKAFQGKLAKIEIPDKLAKEIGFKAKNAWDWLVKQIAQMLGLKNITALEAALKLTREAAETKVPPASLKYLAEVAEREKAALPGPDTAVTPPVPPTPGVAREQAALAAVEAPVEPAAIGETQKHLERWMDLWRRVKSEDLAAKRRRAEKEAKQKISKEWKQNRMLMAVDVRADIQDLPEVQLAELIRSGTFRGDTLSEGPIHLDPDSLTQEQRDGLLKKYQKKGGFRPADLTSIFGMDGNELISKFMELERARGKKDLANHLDDMVDEETDRRMQAKYGDKQEAIMKEAEAHILSPTSMDLVHEETKRIANLLGQSFPLTKADMFAQANEILDNMKAKNLTVASLLTHSGRMARDVRRWLLEGKIEEAFKQQQRYQTTLFMAKLAKEHEKNVRQLARMVKTLKRKEPEGIAKPFIAPLQYLLNKAGISTRNGQEQIRESMELSGWHDAGNPNFAKFVAEQSGKGYDLLFNDPEMAIGNVKDREEWTVEDTRNYFEGLRSVVKAARDQNTVTIAGVKHDVGNVAARIGRNAAQRPELPLDERLPLRKRVWNSITGWQRPVDSYITRAEEHAKDIDLRQDFGPLWSSVVLPVQDAKFTFNNWLVKLSERFAGIKGFGKEWRKSLDDEIKQDFFVDVGRSDGGLHDLTRGDVIGIMLNFGSRSGRDAFLRGTHTKAERAMPKEIKEVIRRDREDQFLDLARTHLTETDWEYIQHIWDTFAMLRDPISAVYHRLTGMPPKWVESLPIDMPHGPVEGGYFPILRDKGRDANLPPNPSAHSLFGPDHFNIITSNHHLTERTKYEGPVKFRDTLGLTAHRLVQAIHDLSYREAIIDAKKILDHEDTRAAINRHYGPEYMRMFDRWIEDVAKQHNTPERELAKLERFMRMMRLNLTGSVLGMNLKLLLTPDVGTMAGVPQTLLHPTESTALAYKWSKEIPHTIRNIDRDLNEKMMQVIRSKGLSGIQADAYRWSFIPVAKISQAFRIATFVDKFKEFQSQGFSKEESASLADSVVRERHGVQTVADMPEIMRGAEWVRALTLFYGFGNTMWNWHRQIFGSLYGPKEMRSWSRAGASLFGTVAITGAFNLLYTKRTRDMDWFQFVGRALIGNEAQMLPFVRELYNYWFEDIESRPAMISILKSLGNAAHDVANLGKKEPKKLIRHIAEAVGGLTRMPLGQVGKTGQFLYDVKTGRQHPENFMEWQRGIISGDSRLPKR